MSYETTRVSKPQAQILCETDGDAAELKYFLILGLEERRRRSPSSPEPVDIIQLIEFLDRFHA